MKTGSISHNDPVKIAWGEGDERYRNSGDNELSLKKSRGGE